MSHPETLLTWDTANSSEDKLKKNKKYYKFMKKIQKTIDTEKNK